MATVAHSPVADGGQVVALPLSSVYSKRQHREDFPEEDIARLAESIADLGLIQPIEVEAGEKHGGKPGTFCVTDGECRFRACGLAGLATVRAFVVENASEADRLARQGAANLARVPLSPMAKARAVGYHLDKLRAEKTWLPEEDAIREVARKCGVSPQFAFAKVGLLRLPPEVQGMLDKDPAEIGERAGLALLPLIGKGSEAEAYAVSLARSVRAGRIKPADVGDSVNDYLQVEAQPSLFGEEIAKESEEARQTKSVLTRVVNLYGRIQEIAFDKRAQDFALGELQAEDLAMAEAKLIGAANWIHRMIAEVQAAQGKSAHSPVSEALPARAQEPVVERPVVRPAASAAVSATPASEATPDSIQTYLRGPQEWLWIHGVPRIGPLAEQVHRAGAVWTDKRGGAWFAVDKDRSERVLAVLQPHLSEPETKAALEAAG